MFYSHVQWYFRYKMTEHYTVSKFWPAAVHPRHRQPEVLHVKLTSNSSWHEHRTYEGVSLTVLRQRDLNSWPSDRVSCIRTTSSATVGFLRQIAIKMRPKHTEKDIQGYTCLTTTNFCIFLIRNGSNHQVLCINMPILICEFIDKICDYNTTVYDL